MTIKNTFSSISFLTLFFISVRSTFAQITNPPLNELGRNVDAAQSGELFVTYFLMIWNALITVGAIAVLLYFVWGAIEWITSGGDSSKLESARNRMLQSIIGMLLLISAYTIIGFLSQLIFGEEFNILQPAFWVPNV